MRGNLEQSLRLILTWEGGFAQRATEPGGAVNRGVSMQTYAAWRKTHGQPAPTVDDLRAMSEEEAIQIYQSQYAGAIGFDELPSGLDLCVLDSAVNEGVGGALRFLAGAIGFQFTAFRPPLAPLLDAVAPASVPAVIDSICDVRLAMKQRRQEWERFGKGWTARIESVRTHAKELVQ